MSCWCCDNILVFYMIGGRLEPFAVMTNILALNSMNSVKTFRNMSYWFHYVAIMCLYHFSIWKSCNASYIVTLKNKAFKWNNPFVLGFLLLFPTLLLQNMSQVSVIVKWLIGNLHEAVNEDCTRILNFHFSPQK